MKSNVGGVDKVVRIVAGLALLSLFLVLDGSARWWGAVGLVPLTTALLGWCPLYTLLGVNSCPVRQ
jgi:hypothetical protein